MARDITEPDFLEDVEEHKMTVLKDDGIYRHLRFASTGPHSWNQWFEIVTWPGHLAYTGDMGTFTFARLEDMFQFFRSRPSDSPEKLYINTDYWAEKLQSVDRDHRNNSEMAFSEDLFRKRVEKEVSGWIEECALTESEQAELREAVEAAVLSFSDAGEYAVHEALRDFSAKIGDHQFEFSDAWEWNMREYTGRFIWCCYALVWAIQQYDAVACAEGVGA